jgi:hypothetical protein
MGTYVRDAPAGKILWTLPAGAPVQILYTRQTVNGVVWLQVRDLFGRTGWVLAQHLIIRP